MSKLTDQPFVELLTKLHEVDKYLLQKFGSVRLFVRPSASQVDSQLQAPNINLFDQAKLYAYVFQSSLGTRELQTILFTTSVVVRRAISLVRLSKESGDLLGVLWQIRSILERIANVYYLKTELDKVSKGIDLASCRFVDTYDYDAIIKNTLYGTLTKWNELAVKDLGSVDIKKFVGKNTKILLGEHAAEQVLNKMDRLDEKMKGVRAAYEILCEYLHPNVGDYYAITTTLSEERERHGLKLIKRTLALNGYSNSPTVDRVVLNKVYRYCTNTIDNFTSDIDSLIGFSQLLENKMQVHVREIIRNNRKLFRRSDTCPCCSGLTAAQCCGKNLNLDV